MGAHRLSNSIHYYGNSMAMCMTINLRYSLWEDYYLLTNKEIKGFEYSRKSTQTRFSFFNGVPLIFVNKPNDFKEAVTRPFNEETPSSCLMGKSE